MLGTDTHNMELTLIEVPGIDINNPPPITTCRFHRNIYVEIIKMFGIIIKSLNLLTSQLALTRVKGGWSLCYTISMLYYFLYKKQGASANTYMILHYVIPIYVSYLKESFLWLRKKTTDAKLKPTHSKQHH